MTEPLSRAEWSPADHPYAIAVSEAMWWRCAAQLAFARLGDPDDPRSAPVSSRQVDARNMVLALVQLLAAESLAQRSLSDLELDPAIRKQLSAARARYLVEVPDIEQIRNAITHFDDWAVGHGRGVQKQDVASGIERREAASTYWAFGYDSAEQTLSLGPFAISTPAAVRAAIELARAIETAAIEVERQHK